MVVHVLVDVARLHHADVDEGAGENARDDGKIFCMSHGLPPVRGDYRKERL
jgi:hypothetical protein